MTSCELLEIVDALLDQLRDDRYLLEILKSLSDAADELIPQIGEYLKFPDPAGVHHHNEAQKAALRAKIEVFKDIDPFTLASEISVIESQLGQFSASVADGTMLLTVYASAIQNFKEAYRNFNRNKALPETVVLLHGASKLYASLISHRTVLQIVQRNLRVASPAANEGRSRFTLNLESVLTFSDFVAKASAIQRSYDNIANLLGVDSTESPLSIIKVESGSAWYDLLGDSRVVGILTAVVTAGAGYIYRRYTKDGRLERIPRAVEAAESVLGLANKLAEQGVNVDAADENLRNTVVKLAADLNEIIGGQRVVRINATVYAVGAPDERPLLKGTPQKAIEHKPEA